MSSEEQTQLESLLDCLSAGIIILDMPYLRVRFINSAAQTCLEERWHFQSLIGRDIEELLPEEEYKIVQPLLQQAAANKQEMVYEEVPYNGFLETKGRTYWRITIKLLQTSLVAFASHNDALCITIEEVTQVVRARLHLDAIQAVSKTLELLIECLPSGVLLVSAHDASIITINDYAVRLLRQMGVPLTANTAAKQLIGANVKTLFGHVTLYALSGSTVPYLEQPLALALYKGEATESELHTLDIDEQPLHMLANAAPLRTPNGSITSAILVLQDITTLKTLERTRENFFTEMAHELKTPLANVRAQLSALLMHDIEWSAEAQQELIQAVDEQVERLIGMINRVLNASRVEAGALHPTFEPILVPELLEDLQERLTALIRFSHRHLKIMIEARLPAIEADYELIMTVLINLLSNAFRYAPEGDVVTLEATIARHSETMQPVGVTLSVRDNGPGITLDQQKQLFKRFGTLSAQTSSAHDNIRWSSTTGLGLYISRGIVEAHHGSLNLTSSPGQGTCFSFTLPIVDSHQFNQQMSMVTVPEIFTGN